MNVLKHISLILIIFAGHTTAQTPDRFRSQILSEDEMLITTGRAIQLIQENKPTEFKNLFAPDIRKTISDSQIMQLTEQLNSLFKNEKIPTDKRDILPSLQVTGNSKDTLFVNNINYNFKSSQTLIFSFLKKYGTKELAGIHLKKQPLNTGNHRPNLKQIEDFKFNVDDITWFRIYYDEGPNKVTKFKNETGYFAVQGDAEKFEKSGIKPILKNIFSDLAQSKYESADIFNDSLKRGEDPKFIQIEFSLKGKPYLISLYLPLLDHQNYSGKIVLMEKEYQNLGYQFILNQNDYLGVVKEFPKILDLKLDNFYEDKP